MTGRLRVPEPRCSRILGLGTYRPSRVVPNAELAARLGLSEAWISKRSGITSRRFATDEETLPFMSVAAGGKALAQAGVAPEQIGGVVAATTTHLTQMPSLASEVAFRLGATAAGAFDVLAACAGFPYAVALGSDLVRAGSADHVLVIGAERITDILDHDDPSTAFLFADGAGAVVIGPSATPGIGPVAWGADGSRSSAVGMTGYWTPDLRTDARAPWPVLGMAGWKVFRWASEEMAGVARRAVELAGLTLDEIEVFVPHQANMLIIDAICGQLGLGSEVVVARDIAESGNTSAASIPLAMGRLLESDEIHSGQRALLIGFGSGLVYAAQVVEVP